MLSLAAFRYRNILAAYGGPLASLQAGVVSVCGRRMAEANARLVPGLARSRDNVIFGDADGSGTHRLPSVARHMAISEALERWAFHSLVRSADAAEFAFDVDPSTNGMSAFPGLRERNAQRKAMLEAVERFCLISWWEQSARWRRFDTDWPGVSAIAIDGPFGGVTALVYTRTDFGMYAYGHAAEESFGAACEKAVVELSRHERAVRAWWLAHISGEQRVPTDLLERRSLFFATQEGHELFQRKIHDNVQREMPAARILCNRPIPGPWSDYATIWRFALMPPSTGYLESRQDYFFW